MILGSLVGPMTVAELDARADDRLGKVFLNEFVTNEVINEELIRNPVIMKELHAAVARAYAKESGPRRTLTPLEVAQKRYAAGDLSREEYKQIVADLRD